jgi:hypothetical protein
MLKKERSKIHQLTQTKMLKRRDSNITQTKILKRRDSKITK